MTYSIGRSGKLLLVLASEEIFDSKSSGTHYHILLFHDFESRATLTVQCNVCSAIIFESLCLYLQYIVIKRKKEQMLLRQFLLPNP
jgi:hypothetical protein